VIRAKPLKNNYMTDLTREIKLPSGRTAAIRKGVGRDLMRAHRVTGHNPEPTAVTFALIAELTLIDGKSIVFEDVLSMDLADVLSLEAGIVEDIDQTGNF
jgi:hypothetical protein